MASRDSMRLCGGTFLVLLLESRGYRRNARMGSGRAADGKSEPDVFAKLIQTVIPDFQKPSSGRTFNTFTSDYKLCRKSDSPTAPLTDPCIVRSYNSEVINNYTDKLSEFSAFLDASIDIEQHGRWFVAALLDLIEADESIPDNAEFFILPNGESVNKDMLAEEEDYCVPSFLMGVWHYIITRIMDNTIGVSTINRLLPQEMANAERQFDRNYGTARTEQITVYTSIPETIAEEQIVSGFMPDVAPELTGDPMYIITGVDLGLDNDDEFAEYLDNAYDKYKMKKTLLYGDEAKPFYDFYVCNDVFRINRQMGKNAPRREFIRNISVTNLTEQHNFIILSGTGGLGKSMMMQHLMLDAIKHYEERKQLPIFIPLKDYTTQYPCLEEYVYDKFRVLTDNFGIDEFIDILREGRCLLLFDGLDEIKSDYIKQFELHLDQFVDRYSDNTFVISSRPGGRFVSYNRFAVYHLNPFTMRQALELIDRLEFRPDEPSIKAKFREELVALRYGSHREFVENPLLLTIMLMTYEQFAELPSKMHIFYREAYITLSQKHDASKGAYKRPLRCKVNAERFADYFAEFCARTYRDERFEFTEYEFERYFNDMHGPKADGLGITASDFATDLTENLCMMYHESQRYHFTHRSFQEYFCAVYFSKQKDRNLEAISKIFEKKNRQRGDQTFAMLHDMIPEKVEEYIFLPYLQKLFAKCDAENGYWTFLQELYPEIVYEVGDVGSSYINDPSSFIYNFMTRLYQLQGYVEPGELPAFDDLVFEKWYQLDDEYSNIDHNYHGQTIKRDQIPSDYPAEFGEPDEVGYALSFEVKEVLKDPDYYAELLEKLDDDNFSLKTEYIAVRAYMEMLQAKQTTDSEDIFDLFQ